MTIPSPVIPAPVEALASVLVAVALFCAPELSVLKLRVEMYVEAVDTSDGCCNMANGVCAAPVVIADERRAMLGRVDTSRDRELSATDPTRAFSPSATRVCKEKGGNEGACVEHGLVSLAKTIYSIHEKDGKRWQLSCDGGCWWWSYFCWQSAVLGLLAALHDTALAPAGQKRKTEWKSFERNLFLGKDRARRSNGGFIC